MLTQPTCEPYLLVPAEVLPRVLSELDIVGRISVDEISFGELDRFKVATTEGPFRKCASIGEKILAIQDAPVFSKRHVEASKRVEAAQSVVTGSIQIVEQCRCFLGLRLLRFDQFVESV